MEKKTCKRQEANEKLSKVDINSIVGNVLHDFIDKDKKLKNDAYENN